MHLAMLNIWGAIDEEITFHYESLRSDDPTAQATKRKTDAETDDILIAAGVIDPAEARARIAGDPDSGYDGIEADDVPEPVEGPSDIDLTGTERPDAVPENEKTARTGQDAGGNWNEVLHPRAANGEFGSGGSAAHAGPVGSGAEPHPGVSEGIDTGERASIRHYTEAGFKSINWGLRGIRQHTPASAAHTAEIDRVMSRASLPEPMVVNRGVGGNGLKSMIAHGFRKGNIIPDPGFLSTSKNHRKAVEFAQQSSDNIVLEIRLPKGGRAVDIGKLSHAAGEQEVLIDRNSGLKVVSYDKKARTAILEWMPHEKA